MEQKCNPFARTPAGPGWICMVDAPAEPKDLVELVVNLGGLPDAAVAEAPPGGDESKLASCLAAGTWLSSLQLFLPAGSRFLLQSGGR